jgi:site-specific DNA-methyltransferase (adenine-specific)
MPQPQPQFQNIRDLLRLGAPPDVLETIAHLSNDEVFTPPKLANQVLDLLPDHVWSNPNLRFLDPAVKTGVFLREAAKRLMVGLKEQIPDDDARREHILKNMLFGIAITEMTALMSRRSLYCATDATRRMNPNAPENCFSAVIMDTPDGNIAFPRSKHDYGDNGKKTHCAKCGAKKGTLDGEDREDRENHAYAFIHQTIEEIFGEKDMKFDVIIGNPPYQLETGGSGRHARPVYHLFIEAAKKLGPKYISFIIPSRWFSGGMGLENFRSEMLSDDSIKHITDYVNASEAFPGVDIAGGVCIFLIEKDYKGPCEFKSCFNGKTKTSIRRLNEFDSLIRFEEAVSIIKKVKNISKENIIEDISPMKPFGLATNDRPDPEGDVILVWSGGVGPLNSERVTSNYSNIDKYKVITGKASFDHAGQPDKNGMRRVLSRLEILNPGEVCTASYIVLGFSKGESEAKFLMEYMKTKFVRFLISTLSYSQDISRDRFRFVPKMDMSRTWTDADLYAHFGLTEDEIAFIESQIKEMP